MTTENGDKKIHDVGMNLEDLIILKSLI